MFATKRQVTITLLLIAFAVSPLFVPTSIADKMSSPPQHTHTSSKHLVGLVCAKPTVSYGWSSQTYETCTIVTVCLIAYSYESKTCTHGVPQPEPDNTHSCTCPNTVSNATNCTCPTGRATTCPCEVSGG